MARNASTKLLLSVFLLLTLFVTGVYAYLDPGTGSYLFQIMLATLVGAAFAVKTYWIKIKDFFKKLFYKNPT
jgi:hypothetical protein